MGSFYPNLGANFTNYVRSIAVSVSVRLSVCLYLFLSVRSHI